ncbi:hypothetical protein ACF0H5_003597 [Mactra antiquata]
MGEHFALPPLSRQNSLVGLKSRRRSFLKRGLSSENIKLGPIEPELVQEDIYLMDNRNRRATINLLANSLTARIKKNLPDGTVDNDAIRKMRRDSLKEFAQLDNLHRQYTSEMHREASRLDKETFQILKRQKQLHKQSEMQRRSQDRLESSMRSRSGMSSASLPPLEDNSGANTADQRDEFPEFATVDKDDQSNVKVFKLNGIYQPTNKYKSRIEPLDIGREKPTVKENNLQESLKMADKSSPVDLPPKSRMTKKNLRVSWSRQSRYYPDDASEIGSVMSQARTETRMSQVDMRSSNASPDRASNVHSKAPRRNFNSRMSVRSDTFLLQKQFGRGRQKIETIGLKWKILPGASQHPETEVPRLSVKQPEVSHNLMPVTTAMQKEGRNTKKVCWQVQKIQNLSSVEMYKAWVRKLEKLKTSAIDDRLNASPSRSNFTVMTQPA